MKWTLLFAAGALAIKYDSYGDGDLIAVKRTIEEALDKRDGLSGAVESIIQTVYSSNLIPKVLSSVANSESTLDSIADLAISGINTAMAAYNESGHNISAITSQIPVNTTQLLNTVVDSGVITSVGYDMLYNDTNRDAIADILGHQLETQYWVPQLLNDLSAGKKLTWDYLADTIRNTESKANETKKEVLLARDTPSPANNYSGSASEFLSNLIGTVISSQLFTGTINDTLTGVANSPELAPLVIEVLQDPNLGTIVSTISSKVYESGVLYQIDLNGLYSWAKKEGYLVEGTQALLTNPFLEPPLAKIFKRMEDHGVYQTVQNNLYGTKK